MLLVLCSVGAMFASLLVAGPAAAASTNVASAEAVRGGMDVPDADLKAATDGGSEQRFVPGEVLVRFRSGVDQQARTSVLAELDATVKDALPLPGLRLVEIEGEASVPEAVEELEKQPEVRYAEPNFIYRTQAIPNDPRFGELWGLDNGALDADIDAPEAWNKTTGSSSVTVAVVDTGVAYDHVDLAPNMWTNPGESGGGKPTNGIDDDGNGLVDDSRGWDYVSDDNDPRDLNGHGTHVAGTIGARGNDGQGVAGVSWRVGLMPVRVLDESGSGTAADVAAGFAYAGAKGADVVNASLGGGGFSQTMLDAINGAPETLFVVAAGNNGDDNDLTPTYPCNYTSPNLVCVAATTESDGVAWFSNVGENSVDLGAPGTNILSAQPGTTVFSEGFENAISSTWATGGTNNTWARTTEAARSGNFSLTDSPGANYLNNTNSFARMINPINLSGLADCRLDYAMRLATDLDFGHDFFWIDTSTNGTSWTPFIWSTGSTGGNFSHRTWDLSAYDGQASLYLGFFMQTNSSVTDDGVHVDDVEIRCLSSGAPPNGYEFLSGTSMATPHVAGTAALILAQHPSASPTAVKAKLLSSVDPVLELAGSTVSGGRLNANNALSPPNTIIDSPPHGTTSDSTPTFNFHSETGSTFQCSLDTGTPSFSPCSGPGASHTPPAPLGNGTYIFRVRATDAIANTDPSPAAETFTIGPAAANTVIGAPKPGPLKLRIRKLIVDSERHTATIKFGSEPGSSFECKLDSKPWRFCRSPKTIKDLEPGMHRIKIQARDPVGNLEPTIAARSFRIQN
jgi:thermitase